MTHPRNTAGIQAAAAAKAEAKHRATLAAIKKLRSDQAAITFNSIARTAGVSTTYLYGNPELRALIERHRTSPSHRVPEPPARGDETGVIAVLRTALHQEREDNKELRRKVHDLERTIEELLGRQLDQ